MIDEELVYEETSSPALISPTLDKFNTFAEAPLHPQLLELIATQGWNSPTPVQAACLPYTLSGRDVAGFAQTGTGKTAVFIITIAHRLLAERELGESKRKGQPFAAIISPTRELAMQIESDAKKILAPLGFNSVAVFGGVDYEKQERSLTSGVDVIVATPGRLKDFFQKRVFDFNSIETFVCDEADRMFDMGFIDDVGFFLEKIPEKSQRLLFSATAGENIKELAFEYLNNPEYISVNPESLTPENIEQVGINVDAKFKLKVLIGLLREDTPSCTIIFTNTKITAEWLHYKLTHNGIKTDIITGDLPQRKRIDLIQRIKNHQVTALIATDVASRGLHISGVTHVYNFDLPDDPQNYVHRIGRTARAGAKGKAISLVCEDYGHNLSSINTMLGENFSLKTSWFDPAFLKIEDKAPNPFEDENSKLSSRHKRKPGHASQREGRERFNKGKDQRPQRHKQPSGGGRPHEGQRHRQGGSGHRSQTRGGQQPQRHSRPEHPHKRQHQFVTETPRAKIAAKSPDTGSGVGKMIKKLIGALFGSKS